ncbi:acetyltransferase [uncultured Duncaniella sp.]|uniref:acetyltransferase n=1 Tax=uncultured Duncaniella sp. TaxID=2768039 RepID=UPI002676DC14|nr:acetyltransferase [uncultured Duncaniella sp.]MCI9172998.1 acetyltransferase [Muribaculaceae bacterium]
MTAPDITVNKDGETHIVKASANDHTRLIEIWESSVKATHDFLAESDFAYYRSRMPEYLSMVDLYVCRDCDGAALGFMGVAGTMLEMLFVDAGARGKGIGRRLLTHAVTRMGVDKVDVNEQNVQAIGFYERMGFAVTGRSELDGEGRPYPLLHMQRATDGGI